MKNLFVLLTLLLSVSSYAQTNDFTKKEKKEIFSSFKKINNEERKSIDEQVVVYVEKIGKTVFADIVAHPCFDTICVDTADLKRGDILSIILKYNADNKLDITKADNNDYELMHFYNAIFLSGGIESVMGSLLFSFFYIKYERGEEPKIKRYKINYEFVQQKDSIIIYNRTLREMNPYEFLN